MVATRTTARSDNGSAPTTSKRDSVPSEKVARPVVCPATTWADVRRKPSGVTITALPPPARRPSRSWRLATDPSSSAATRVTVDE